MSIVNEPTIREGDILRPTHLEINLTRLTENYRAIETAVSPAKVMPILKANAYGHGLVEIAQHLEKIGALYFGVAFLEEGILLREAGITTPILVLGGIIGNQIPLFLKYNLTLTASSVEKLSQIDETAVQMNTQAKVHIKIDTGMERIGVHYYSAESLLEATLMTQNCTVEGIYSHFANSDSDDLSYTDMQLKRFHSVLSFFQEHDIDPPPIRHMANSGGILQRSNSHFDMVRAGILLYGVYPSEHVAQTVVVRPCLTWKSRVVYFKVVQPNHPVSYGSTWQSDHMVRLVTLPVGYGDGYFRGMSERAEVIIRGKRYPVVGRICMDQMMVNIEWETAYNNDEVILMGESNDVTIRAEEMAQWANTIPYEIMTNINTRVPRRYFYGE